MYIVYHRNAFEHSVMLIFCHIIPLLVTMTQNTTHRMYYTFFLLISWRLSIRSGVLYSLALAYNEPFEVLSHYSIHCLFHFLQTFLSLFFFSPSSLYQLETGPHAPVYQLLNLFAYGTYSDYKGKQKNEEKKRSFDSVSSAPSGSHTSLSSSPLPWIWNNSIVRSG